MVDFNPNAGYSARTRKVDSSPTEVIKQNGNYYVQNEDGSYEQVDKTRNGSIFHKAQFSRRKTDTYSNFSNDSSVNPPKQSGVEESQDSSNKPKVDDAILKKCGDDPTCLKNIRNLAKGKLTDEQLAEIVANSGTYEEIRDNILAYDENPGQKESTEAITYLKLKSQIYEKCGNDNTSVKNILQFAKEKITNEQLAKIVANSNSYEEIRDKILKSEE